MVRVQPLIFGGFSLKRTDAVNVEQIIIFILAQIYPDLLHNTVTCCHLDPIIILISGGHLGRRTAVKIKAS